MKIIFLGTGTSLGIPMIASKHRVCFSEDSKDKRLRTSILIQKGNKNILIDCGPDFRQQILRIACDRIDAILYTHEHFDHIAGLDEVRPLCYINKMPIPIYGLERVIEAIKMRFTYIFETENKYKGAPEVIPNIVDMDTEFKLFDNPIIPILVNHGSIDILGYRLDDLVYITDCKYIYDRHIHKLKGCKTLVINALRNEPHPTHMHLGAALELVELIKPERAYFTHISPDLGFHREVEKLLPPNVFLAYDNLEIEV